MKKDEYIFKSERLGFRNWTNEDLDEFAKLNSDEDVMEHFPETLTKDEVGDLIKKLKNHFSENGFTYYATEILETKEFIGMIGLAFQEYKTNFTPAIDIGWRLKRNAWGKGYATEGAKRCIEYAFNELDINKIVSVCTIQNKKSENVMKKIGMTKKGEFNHPELINHPEYKKHFCYEIKKMISQEIKDIINKELEGQSDLTNVYGININECLIEPIKENYLSPQDESITVELWTVLEQLADRSGYKVTFNETKRTFGLGIMTDKNKLMDMGTYGTFLEALKGM